MKSQDMRVEEIVEMSTRVYSSTSRVLFPTEYLGVNSRPDGAQNSALLNGYFQVLINVSLIEVKFRELSAFMLVISRGYLIHPKTSRACLSIALRVLRSTRHWLQLAQAEAEADVRNQFSIIPSVTASRACLHTYDTTLRGETDVPE